MHLPEDSVQIKLLRLRDKLFDELRRDRLCLNVVVLHTSRGRRAGWPDGQACGKTGIGRAAPEKRPKEWSVLKSAGHFFVCGAVLC